MKLPTVFESPFFTFCIPPGIAVLQFLLGTYFLFMGFLDVRPQQNVYAALLVIALFSLCLLPLLGVAIGFRQILYGQTKAISALGAAFNGLYFVGCVLFFVLVFVTHSTN